MKYESTRALILNPLSIGLNSKHVSPRRLPARVRETERPRMPTMDESTILSQLSWF